MEALPPDIERSLFKAVGAYLRATPATELPTSVRRFAGFREAAMARYKNDILALLDDEAMRALMEEWLREEKPRLSKKDAANLAIATRREDGWFDELRARAESDGDPIKEKPESAGKLTESLDREKAKAKKAKDDLQRVRAEYEAELKRERARMAKLGAELEAARSTIETLDSQRAKAERDRKSAAERAEREVRRARRDADRAIEQRDKLRLEMKDVRHELRAARAKAASAEPRGTAPKKAVKRPSEPKPRPSPRQRKPLPVPKGRFEDAPETLDEWLRPGVTLIVDGYNVTKAERGFGELKLETQRDRLIKEVELLARRKKVTGTIVFDGSEVQPGTSRNRRGPVRIEFSAPDEIADDHIVALVEGLPPDPIVLVTNDRELQDRARTLGATIARSDQLLALIRP
jgi:predicted RNA-binding protein with PIN domain